MTRVNSDNLYGPSKYLVDLSAADGAYTTIQSAMDALNAAGNFGTVIVKAGIYNENLSFYANQQIFGMADEGRVQNSAPVIVIGAHTFLGDGSPGNFGATLVQGIFFHATVGDLFTITNNGPNGIVFAAKFCQLVADAGHCFVLDKVGAGVFSLAVTFEADVNSNGDGFRIVGDGCQAINYLSSVDSNTIAVNLIGAGCAFLGTRCELNGNLEAILLTQASQNANLDYNVLSANGPTINFAAAGNVNAMHCTHTTSSGPGFYIDGAAGNYNYADDILRGTARNIAAGITQSPYDWKPYATAGNTGSAVRGTAGFDSTQFTVANGFVSLLGGGSYFSLSPYIVGQVGDTHAEFTSVNAAIAQAVADGASGTAPATIYIKPGSYTEDVAMFEGISLVGFTAGFNASIFSPSLVPETQILGTVSASYVGQANINGIGLVGTIGQALNITTGAGPFPTVLTLNNCTLAADATMTVQSSSDNCVVSFLNCLFQQEGGFSYFNKSGDGEFNIDFCRFDSITNSVANNPISDGQVRLNYSAIDTGIIITGDGALNSRHCEMYDPTGLVIDQSSTQVSSLKYCVISNSIGPPVNVSIGSALTMQACAVTGAASPEISGSGTLTYDHLFGPVALSGTLTVINFSTLPIASTSLASRGHAYFSPADFTVSGTGEVFSTHVGIPWLDYAGSSPAVANTGSFILPAGVTMTLPTAPTQGTVCDFAVTTTASPAVIQAGGADIIRIGTGLSSAGGTATSTADGDSIHLVYRTGDSTWHSIGGPQGSWTLA